MSRDVHIAKVYRHLAKFVFMASLLAALAAMAVAVRNWEAFWENRLVYLSVILIFVCFGPLMYCCAWLGRLPDWLEKIYPSEMVDALKSHWRDR